MNRIHSWLTGRESLRSRLTFIATFSFALAFAVASVTLVRTVRNSLESSKRQTTQEALSDLVNQIQGGAKLDDVHLTSENVEYQIRSSDGTVLSGSTAPGSPVFAVSDEGSFAANGQLYSVQRRVQVDNRPVTVATASPLADVDRSVDTLVNFLRVGTPLLVLLLGLFVWFLVGRALAPVETMRAQLAEIGGATLDRRISVGDADDEVARLADTMNAMLTRLEVASARQREFVSDASHELRSPTSAIRAELEVALQHPDAADWPETARRSLSETERLSKLVDDLLTLARFDEGSDTTVRRVTVDLDEIALGELDRAHRVPVGTETVSAGRVLGDAGRLAQVARNLVDNAVRHAREKVAIGVCVEDGEVVLDVDDDGPGVDASDRERIFDRFARLDDGRSRAAGGTGLGLAVVRKIVEAHGGSVAVSDSPLLGGARFTVRLPAAPL